MSQSIQFILYLIILYCILGVILVVKKHKPNAHNNPIDAVHHALTKLGNFPKDKVLINKDKTKILIAYGKSGILMIEKLADKGMNFGIYVDNSTKQSKLKRAAEFEELKLILTSCELGQGDFNKELAKLTALVMLSESKKYSKISRQIPHDML